MAVKLDYSIALLRPTVSSLTPDQRKVNKRLPRLAEIINDFRYDAEWNRLLRRLETGDWEYIENDRFCVTINHRRYAIWRIKSLLILGTPDGRIAHEDELVAKLSAIPPSRPVETDTRPLLVTDKLVRQPIVEPWLPSLTALYYAKMRNDMANNSMQNFRSARKKMGFVHTSSYVPSNRLSEYSIFVDRLKAERMIEICSLPGNDPARIALSERNFSEMPSITDLNAAMQQYAVHKEVTNLIKKVRKHVDSACTARAAVSLVDPGDTTEYVKMVSLALAHNQMASVLWREFRYTINTAGLKPFKEPYSA